MRRVRIASSRLSPRPIRAATTSSPSTAASGLSLPRLAHCRKRATSLPIPATPFLQDAEAKPINFAVPLVNAHLSGTLRDEAGTPVPDTTFRAEETSGSGRFTTFATEDPDGAFNIGLTNGTWRLRPDFDEATDSDLVFIVPGDFTLSANQTIAGIDLRVQEPTRHIVVHVKER